MPSAIASAFLALIILYALKLYLQFARNLKAAKGSGLKYIVLPIYHNNRLYQISLLALIPLARKLPKSWTESWFHMTLEWAWSHRYEPFQRIGSDTFIAVSPERNVLYTADADVIAQITTRRNDFPKALEVYESIKLFGDNVIATEGQTWRHHRKITSPPFSEKNNHLVWTETLDQCQAMLEGWLDGNREASKTIYTIADDFLRLSLHVISKAGFGVRLQWPGSQGKPTSGTSKKEDREVTSGFDMADKHKMSYVDALVTLVHNVILLIATPRFLLKHLPFQSTKSTYTAFVEWGDYMDEMIQSKKMAVLSGDEGDNPDLMIALLKGAGISADNLARGETATSQSLSNDEIRGNAFAFLLAGHETAANSHHFSLVLLALNVASQRHLQSDLDEILQGRPASQWDYDELIPKLFSSMAGAVLNEELRLIPAVTGIPKCTFKGSPQPLTVDGKQCTVPENVYVQLQAASVHRNPKYWPPGPPSDPKHPAHPISNLDNDLEEFKPERWLLNGDAALDTKMSNQDQDKEASDLGLNTAADTSSSLYRPQKGAYIPFSEGYRSCIGRRFAQVEILAVLALIFSQYSVELAVDAYASDEEVERMDGEERRNVWGKAKREVERQLRDDMGSIITLQLRKGAIGLRLVKRGKERFDWR